LTDQLRYLRLRLAGMTQSVPRGAIYLNIAELRREFPRYFEWLGRRDDVRAVFFVHDLLPLDYPEYFRPGYQALFQRRFNTMARWGAAFIVSTESTRKRLSEALTAAQKPHLPIHVAALPSPLAPVRASAPNGGQPYFMLISTIEPRKNHLLVLNIWRALATDSRNDVPKLVLLGASGWEHEQVTDMLDRCEAIRPYVFRAARLSRAGLVRLLVGAQALLMPSFDEGYGLPIVEALTLGTPVIASDIATFREVTQGCALLLSPLDGMRWKEAIQGLSQRESPVWKMAKAKTAAFRAPDWQNYFRGTEDFLNSL
jgi:glycosyltransferase involved in cell wall biosynthesis